MEFYAKVSPVFSSQKYLIPPPTLCPDCRQQRRLSFRNERKLYKRKCDATGADIVSIYSPDKPFIVYHQDYWWSDKWDPMSYGREVNMEMSMMEQFGEIMREVPKPSLLNANLENSEYVNYSSNLKDCYLTFDVSNLENCFYANNCDLVKKSIDISEVRVNSSDCYECLDCNNSNRIAF
jgi:hypothetical protein